MSIQQSNIRIPDRIKLSRNQSIAVYGNPYGDQCNQLLINLNIAYKLRLLLHHIRLDTDAQVSSLDAEIKKSVEYLQQQSNARPYAFSQFTGYYYIDLSSSNWEGHFSNY